MTGPRPTLNVVVGSIRPGRLGPVVARWLAEVAGDAGGFDVVVSDLKELDFSGVAEPELPYTGQYRDPATVAWASAISRSDAVVIVAPEYNGSYPGPLKTAIDLLGPEWRDKPVGLVGYSAIDGGTRVVDALTRLGQSLGMSLAANPVVVGNAGALVEDSRLVPDPVTEQAGRELLASLLAAGTGSAADEATPEGSS
ncbi:MAG: NAD(P)H-dependent oxidoreductase [Bifidobacteriaceae bacterium]|jgi:NAD(P)H-dependent FMN reductase|nr:NAD(P)H-dependent oxidoreductase [Bifidobacteriaceae bacterium]